MILVTTINVSNVPIIFPPFVPNVFLTVLRIFKYQTKRAIDKGMIEMPVMAIMYTWLRRGIASLKTVLGESHSVELIATGKGFNFVIVSVSFDNLVKGFLW